jgi:hypothetical protein
MKSAEKGSESLEKAKTGGFVGVLWPVDIVGFVGEIRSA